MGSREAGKKPFDIVIIGGGFSGIYQLHTLRAAGFSVRLIEAGSALGGIWESWKDFDWREHFPGGDEIQRYMRHLDDVWDLSRDVSYDTRVVGMRWGNGAKRWKLEAEGQHAGTMYSQFVILCTGFASKPYIPPYRDIDLFRGELLQTSLWPQHGVDLKGKRVAVIAIPMTNPSASLEQDQSMKYNYPATKQAISSTFAGFDYEFAPGSAISTPKAQRLEMYEKLFHTGGLHFWLGTYQDVLFNQSANDEAYEFWRQKTLPRIHGAKNQDLRAPKLPLDPFGTKRISLEDGYFETFNQANVSLISTRDNPISHISAKGVVTTDGTEHECDTLCLATGFDSIAGGITQIETHGTDPTATIKDKWSKGVHTHLGMTTHGFPNMFFTYGPQAPTAFATGPASAGAQGQWIVALLMQMRSLGQTTVEATREAEVEYREHVHNIGGKGLFKEARSWYYGDNIPGKPREALNYMAGLPAYKKRCWECAENGYSGFVLA